MIVVLDTNIWLQQLVLKSSVGSALRFFLKQRNARVAVPEVIRLETQENLRRMIREAMDSVKNGTDRLLQLFGSMREVVLPTSDQVEIFVNQAFDRLGVETVDVPFSFESARSSFMKTIRKDPPSDKSQQFKDGVLWADCLLLLGQDDVLLATEDKAFFADKQYEKGLAKNLASELEGQTHRLALVSSIMEVLKEIRNNVSIDEVWLASVLRMQMNKESSGFLSQAGVAIADVLSVETSIFATEDPALVYVNYVVEFSCNDLSDQGRTQLRLSISGDGTLRLNPREIVATRINQEILSFTNADGTDGSTGIHHLVAADLVLGHRTVEHTVRYPVGGAGQPGVGPDVE